MTTLLLKVVTANPKTCKQQPTDLQGTNVHCIQYFVCKLSFVVQGQIMVNQLTFFKITTDSRYYSMFPKSIFDFCIVWATSSYFEWNLWSHNMLPFFQFSQGHILAGSDNAEVISLPNFAAADHCFLSVCIKPQYWTAHIHSHLHLDWNFQFYTGRE